MHIKNQKDFFAGLLFIVAGLGFAFGASGYTVGEAARMGPGYFPLLLGILLAILGGIMVFKSLVVETLSGERIGAWAFKPLVCVIGANLLFGILLGGVARLGIPPMGLIVAVYALTIVAARASAQFKWREVLVLATLLAAGSWATFVWALGLAIRVWPDWPGA
ncbi:MAG: tripartite tricarboxylate transporter TctB family protein [Burkholderiaceae bacterium]|nr:tripartite tricarboxylate transporter TctB family protein [Burkholderiaceae bacterium]